MDNIIIKSFDPNRLHELAKAQVKIYNQAIENFPDYFPTKVDDVVKRFQNPEFDPKRMYYAFNGETMIGYSGLSTRNQQYNSRTVGYPWLLKGVDPNVRNILYDAMEKQCKKERTRSMCVYVSERYIDIIEFFRSKNFHFSQDYIILEKKLSKNTFKKPDGYIFRSLKEKDIPMLETISLHDPSVKERFISSDWTQFMNFSEYSIDDVIVAEKDGKVVGFYALSIPSDEKKTKTYFAGVAVNKKDHIVESFLQMELENRAFERGKKTLEISYSPYSKRLPLAKEKGFEPVGITLKLEKFLS